MNKILRLVCRQADFKKIVSIGFFAAFLAVFLSTGIVKAETTYKWVNNGLVSESDGRYTGSCSIEGTSSNDYVCNSSTKGNKLYDGTDRGSSYGDTGHAWPIYKGENTSTAKKYTYDSSSCTLAKRTGGTVNEWECKSSDSSSSSNNSSSKSSSSSASAKHTATTSSATNITSTSATLNGAVNPNGEETSYLFAYRKTSDSSSLTKYAPSNTYTSVGSGSSDVSVSADISGLSSGTKYVYRLYAYSSTTSRTTKQTVNGELKSFTTSGSSSSVSSGASSSSSSSVQQYTLKVKISGRGQITSSGGSGVISCVKSKSGVSGDCSVKFKKGESVTLTPSTNGVDYEFAIWAGACAKAQKLSACTIIMDGDKTVSATFNKKSGSNENTATVSVRKTGKGSGKVISINYKGSAMAGINCGSDCSENFKQLCETSATRDGTCGTVYFKATADKGSTFGGWGGDCLTFKNEKNQCYVNLEGDKTITASFSEKKSKSKSSSSQSSKSSSSSSSKSSSSSSSSASANHTASNGSATNVTSTSATLNGTVNPKGENVSYMFTYGKKGVSGAAKNTSWKSAGNGSSDVSVSANISGLSSGTEYYYYINAYSYTTKTYVYGAYATSTRESFTTSGGSSSSSSSSSSSQTTASTYKLKVTISGNGRIQDNYSKIDCVSNMACEATYSKGQVIRIKTDDTDSTGASYNTKVESWSGGDCSGTGNSCGITMDSDKEVTVKFVSK